MTCHVSKFSGFCQYGNPASETAKTVPASPTVDKPVPPFGYPRTPASTWVMFHTDGFGYTPNRSPVAGPLGGKAVGNAMAVFVQLVSWPAALTVQTPTVVELP
jgi:hypothetical protein